MRRLVLIIGLALPGLTNATGLVPTRYKFESATITDLGTLGGVVSVAHDINEGGDVVGWSYDANFKPHAVAWFNGTIHDLHNGSPAWEAATAYGINNNRQIVGEYLQPGSQGLWRAFMQIPGGWVTPLAGHNPAPELLFDWDTHAYAINSSGRIAGEAVRKPNFSLPDPPDTGDLCYENLPVQWQPGGGGPARLFCTTDVNNDNDYNPDGTEGLPPRALDVNDYGNFVGTDGKSTQWSMFLFKGGVRIPVPAPAGAPDLALDGEADGLNNKNWVVGTFGWPDGGVKFRAFVWNGVSAKSQNIGMLAGGSYSFAEEINEQNMVAGTSERGYGPWPMKRDAAYIWHSDFGMKQLPGLTGVYGNNGGVMVWMYDRCRAYSLNDRKPVSGVVQVVGECDVGDEVHAVRWDVKVSVRPIFVLNPGVVP